MRFELNGREGGGLKWVSRFLFMATIFLLMAQPTASLSDDALLIYQVRSGRNHIVQPMMAPLLALEWLAGPGVFAKGELMRCHFEKGVIAVRGVDDVSTKLKADILVCGESKFVIVGVDLANH